MSTVQVISADGKRQVSDGRVWTINDTTQSPSDCGCSRGTECPGNCACCSDTYTVVITGDCSDVNNTYICTRSPDTSCDWSGTVGNFTVEINCSDSGGGDEWTIAVIWDVFSTVQAQYESIPCKCPPTGTFTVAGIAGRLCAGDDVTLTVTKSSSNSCCITCNPCQSVITAVVSGVSSPCTILNGTFTFSCFRGGVFAGFMAWYISDGNYDSWIVGIPVTINPSYFSFVHQRKTSSESVTSSISAPDRIPTTPGFPPYTTCKCPTLGTYTLYNTNDTCGGAGGVGDPNGQVTLS